MDFLQLSGKSILVFGVANRKSVAFHVAELLHQCGAKVIYSVRSDARKTALQKILATSQPQAGIYVCDVEHEDQLQKLADDLTQRNEPLHGVLHAIAYAGYESGLKSFHETPKKDFLRSMDISCFSLIAIARVLRPLLDPDASVVTVSISTTRMASENYGYMAPVKAALDSTIAFLAKSFSQFSRVRFNAVAPGLLKTSASAGIPGYVDSYLYAEQATLRKRAVQTSEVANVAAFLLSPRSAGINTERVIVDAGMATNFFDRQLIDQYMKGSSERG